MLPDATNSGKRCRCQPAPGRLLQLVHDRRGRPRVGRVCRACNRLAQSVPLACKPRRTLLELLLALDDAGVCWRPTRDRDGGRGLTFQPGLPRHLAGDWWHCRDVLTRMACGGE